MSMGWVDFLCIKKGLGEGEKTLEASAVPKALRQGISFRNLNRRLLPAGRMLVSVEDCASLHPPQAD